MLKAVISNNETVHCGNFGVNVVISHPVSDLTIADFVFEAVDGNGITGVELPDAIEVAYVGVSKQTSLMIPVELPEDVSGSFRVFMRSRMYLLDWTQYESEPDSLNPIVAEEQPLVCESKVFEYYT